MSSKPVKIKIESKIVKVKEGDNKTEEYEIRTKDGGEQTVNFEKGCQKDEVSKDDLTLEFRKKGTDK
jgi:VCBS repeat-containing protein